MEQIACPSCEFHAGFLIMSENNSDSYRCAFCGWLAGEIPTNGGMTFDQCVDTWNYLCLKSKGVN